MNCRELEELFSAHALAELTPEQRAAVAAHVAACAACRGRRGGAERAPQAARQAAWWGRGAG